MQRFEVFLGRFVGLVVLLSLVLLCIWPLALLYVERSIRFNSLDPDARKLSRRGPRSTVTWSITWGKSGRPRARTSAASGTTRSYIFGPMPNQPTQYAIWNFREIPDLSGHP